MSGRENEIALPFAGLVGVAFYDGRREDTDDGYKQAKLSYESFDWEWYVNREDYSCARATYLEHGARVLGWPLSTEHPAVYDFPAESYMLHDMSRIWSMSPEDFEDVYRSTQEIFDLLDSWKDE